MSPPNRPAQYAVSMIHPAQPGSSRQFLNPAQVSDVMMMSLKLYHVCCLDNTSWR